MIARAQPGTVWFEHGCLTWLAELLLRVRTPLQGGAKVDNLAWALAQPGVRRAWVFPLARGAGTVDVAFLMDGKSPIIPASADVANVRATTDALWPVTADGQVFSPVGDPLAVTIADLQPDTAATHAAINAAAADLSARDAVSEGPHLSAVCRAQ